MTPYLLSDTYPENEGAMISQMPVAIYHSSSVDFTCYVKSPFEEYKYVNVFKLTYINNLIFK